MRCRIPFLALLAVCAVAPPAEAQSYDAPAARRHFITVSYGSIYTEPLHFAEHPLGDLLGREVASAQGEAYEYRTRDDQTRIDVLEFSRRQKGFGVSLYPIGLSSGPALMLRGSLEPLPRIQIAFEGPAAFARYALTDARALDGAVGLIVADRSPGWGLGSHAFVLGGVGRITSDLGDGGRYFAEGGGGLSVGPLGVELGVKFAWNTMKEPVEHKFLTIPISLRGTVTF